MRWVFVLVMVVLFESLSYAAARSLGWGFGRVLGQQANHYLLWGILAISNGLLAIAVLRVFSLGLKLAMMWLTLLWLLILTTLAVALINALVQFGMARFGLTGWQQQAFYQQYGVMLMLGAGFIGLLGLSVYNAYCPVVRHLRIQLDKPLATPLRIGMVSDLHVGWLVGKGQLSRLTRLVRQEQVQLLLMPGDIMDDDVQYYRARHMQPQLQALVQTVPLGVYATLGNHDLYGHRAEITDALRQAGVHVLVDDSVLVNHQVWLAGRLDAMIGNRKATAALMPANLNQPIILMDHRPSHIDENTQLPIDLQVSGHTHNGQIFPANFIVKYLNTVAYGYKKIRNTHVVVSSGFGFWGVPFRLGSQSEVWVIDLVGKRG